MKLSKLILIVISVTILVVLNSAFAQSYNYEEMEMEEYEALLAEWQGRLDAAQVGINEEDNLINDLQSQLDDTQAQIDATWGEIYAALGSSKAEDDQFNSELDALRNDVSAFLNLSPEEIYSRMDELKALKDRLNGFKENNLALLTANETKLNNIESMILQAEEKGKPAVPDTYTVMRGDYLWKIASKSEIYSDPYAWSRIYTSNTDQIKDANLIYTNQVFRIPRSVGPNEHLVVRGEFLSKISGYANVYGSPFKWQRIYEANKDVVTDPNVVYPYQVLNIPR
jgi:nucleoid-associated protein YgaU